jgi:hypothetical protein
MKVSSYHKIFFLLAVGFSLMTPAATAQRRDYLNEKEADLVRDNQQIDLRIDILIKAIDRRFMVLNAEPEGRKDWQKASDLWGEMPAGPSPALYGDINKLLQKAVDDIDDVAAHDRMDSKFFPRAVRALGSSAEKYLPRLKTAFEKTKDEKEKGSLIGSIELCEQIVEAVGKLPPEVKETKKEKKNKKSGT